MATGAFPNFLEKLKKMYNMVTMNPLLAGSQYFLRMFTVAFGYRRSVRSSAFGGAQVSSLLAKSREIHTEVAIASHGGTEVL